MPVPDAVEALIADAPVSAHLATSVDDRPHVAPVWYGYRNDRLYCLTAGKKLANLRQNPRVALSIERAVGGDVDWQVTLLGRATVIEDPERMAWAESWIFDRYEEDVRDAETEEAGETADGGSERLEGTDGGGDGTEAADGEAGATDGGENDPDAGDDEEDADGALVEIAVRSAAWDVY